MENENHLNGLKSAIYGAFKVGIDEFRKSNAITETEKEELSLELEKHLGPDSNNLKESDLQYRKKTLKILKDAELSRL